MIPGVCLFIDFFHQRLGALFCHLVPIVRGAFGPFFCDLVPMVRGASIPYKPPSLAISLYTVR